MPDTGSNKTLTPISFFPTTGPARGGQDVFIEILEPVKTKGSATVSCQFGNTPAVIAQFDKKSNQYRCTVPPHLRPEPVPVSLAINGSVTRMEQPYWYTTSGKSDSPTLVVHLEPIKQRLRAVRAKFPLSQKLCVVLKAGQPAGWIGRALESTGLVDYFCVPRLEDGIALRQAGVETPIHIMYLTQACHLPQLLHYDLEPSAYSLVWIAQVQQRLSQTNACLAVHLWVDTGMTREGVMPEEALILARAIGAAKQLKLAGIATHFCSLQADDITHLQANNPESITVRQKNLFDQVIQAIRSAGYGKDALCHASSSDGLRYGLNPIYYDMVRVGTLIFENTAGLPENYSWQTHILQIKTVPAGWCLDYDCIVRFSENTRVGLIAHIPDIDATYAIRGKPVSKLLDHEAIVVLDLSGFPEVVVGEVVTLHLADLVDISSPLRTHFAAPVSLVD